MPSVAITSTGASIAASMLGCSRVCSCRPIRQLPSSIHSALRRGSLSLLALAYAGNAWRRSSWPSLSLGPGRRPAMKRSSAAGSIWPGIEAGDEAREGRGELGEHLAVAVGDLIAHAAQGVARERRRYRARPDRSGCRRARGRARRASVRAAAPPRRMSTTTPGTSSSRIDSPRGARGPGGERAPVGVRPFDQARELHRQSW